MPNIAVLLVCYKRPEYTAKCVAALEAAQAYHDTSFFLIDDGSNDETAEILRASKLPIGCGGVFVSDTNKGLRNRIIFFFEETLRLGFDYIVKVDNDCEVPQNWLDSLVTVLETSNADIVSPNVIPSNAAYIYGRPEPNFPYRPSKIVGGLWAMRTKLLDGIYFEKFKSSGIKGAFHLLNQIITEKEPVVGWVANVTVQDIGHWSGQHPDHIKTEAHAEYSAEVGRTVSW